MVPRGPTIRKRLSPNSTTTVAAYIITGIHIYAWNTRGLDAWWREVNRRRDEARVRRERRRVRGRGGVGNEEEEKDGEDEECARERGQRTLVRLS